MGVFSDYADEISNTWDLGTFLAQLAGFAIIVLLLWKFVRPPVARMMKQRQEDVRRQLDDAQSASRRRETAAAAHSEAIKNAEAEGESLRAEAKSDAAAIAEDLTAQAEHERARIAEQSASQVDLQRANMVRRLRLGLGSDAVDRAGELVRAHLNDPAAQAATVDRAIDQLDEMAQRSDAPAPTASNADLIGLHSMRSVSRDTALAVSEAFTSATASQSPAELQTVGDEIAEVIEFVNSSPVLRRRLVESVDDVEPKKALVRRLFEGKVAVPTLAVISEAAAGRWASSADFTTALRRQSALAVLAAAERDGKIDKVEDELFAVGRLLEGNPELSTLLSDRHADAGKRAGMLQSLIGSKVDTYTSSLVSNAVRLLDGAPADTAVDRLAELAAARRGESVAHVQSATELTEAQAGRLTEVLGRIYGRQISVQTEQDAELLGGLRIAVGDEVIDSGIATALNKAAQSLPR